MAPERNSYGERPRLHARSFQSVRHLLSENDKKVKKGNDERKPRDKEDVDDLVQRMAKKNEEIRRKHEIACQDRAAAEPKAATAARTSADASSAEASVTTMRTSADAGSPEASVIAMRTSADTGSSEASVTATRTSADASSAEASVTATRTSADASSSEASVTATRTLTDAGSSEASVVSSQQFSSKIADQELSQNEVSPEKPEGTGHIVSAPVAPAGSTSQRASAPLFLIRHLLSENDKNVKKGNAERKPRDKEDVDDLVQRMAKKNEEIRRKHEIARQDKAAAEAMATTATRTSADASSAEVCVVSSPQFSSKIADQELSQNEVSPAKPEGTGHIVSAPVTSAGSTCQSACSSVEVRPQPACTSSTVRPSTTPEPKLHKGRGRVIVKRRVPRANKGYRHEFPVTHVNPTCVQQSPYSGDQGSVHELLPSSNQTQSSVQQLPASSNQTQSSVQQLPASCNQTQSSAQQLSASSQQAQSSAQQLPASSQHAQSSAQQLPASSQQAQGSAEQSPTSSTSPPKPRAAASSSSHSLLQNRMQLLMNDVMGKNKSSSRDTSHLFTGKVEIN